MTKFIIFFLIGCGLLYGEDPLPSWNEGLPKKAIIDFIQATTIQNSPDFVPPDQRIAVFDQDGTLWVEKPFYTQVRYVLDRLPLVAEQKPALKNIEPFKTALLGTKEALTTLTLPDLEKIAAVTLTGMTVEQFQKEVLDWLKTAKDPRWQRLYTELTYQPMQEVLNFFRLNGYKTYIVTGGGQDFVRVYAQSTYGIPPEQVVGTTISVHYGYDSDGLPILTKEPKLLLNDNNAGKPEGIHIFIGRRPFAAFGNSTGDREMLEYTKSGPKKRLAMLLLHDDPEREYAYGPAEGLPSSNVGTFSQALYDEALKKGFVIIRMKEDWNKVF